MPSQEGPTGDVLSEAVGEALCISAHGARWAGSSISETANLFIFILFCFFTHNSH